MAMLIVDGWRAAKEYVEASDEKRKTMTKWVWNQNQKFEMAEFFHPVSQITADNSLAPAWWDLLR